ncbi:zinc finger CCCH domain-containing protein [Musa troglodytarum]|uniref:Zinc finger CCCH domain-containing protein n=1 Tax=Musa troglodytarum TaxID=320322 RepID=A0A9E7JXA9_9LILI|nr:zinc finger CCCH domain-containing protein [Musa troglodytarum]
MFLIQGSKLEYRHCEGARFNPKDCSYWLKGKCLNPRCTFGHHQFSRLFITECTISSPHNCMRHHSFLFDRIRNFEHFSVILSPRESLFRNPRAMAVPAEPSSSTAVQVADRPPPNNINRYTIPCSFFMKGKGLKGTSKALNASFPGKAYPS